MGRRHILRNVLPYLNQSTMAMRPLLVPCKQYVQLDTTSDLNHTTLPMGVIKRVGI